MKLNKKGMEFAVGTFVGIVLGLAMFIAGAMIFYQIYDSATLTAEQVDSRTRDQILRTFSDGSLLYLPQSSINVGRDRDVRVYFAVQNMYNEEHDFNVNIDKPNGFTDNDIVYFDNITVQGQSRDVGVIAINTRNLNSGQNVFTISLQNSTEDTYGNARVFTINI